MTFPSRPSRLGIGGPIGSGKTMLVLRLCEKLRDTHRLAVVTNDIYTREDANFLAQEKALDAERIVGVETGGCPHTAIRDDTSMNEQACEELARKFPLDLILLESGGDNLTATFSPELVDAYIYVLDVAEGDKMPRKGGPAIRFSDLLLINKIDLAPYVGANLENMERDTQIARAGKPYQFCDLKTGKGLDEVVGWVEKHMLFAKEGKTLPPLSL